MDNSKLSQLWPCVAVLLAVFLLTGCQEQNKVSFNENIRQSLDSVQAGDLEMAGKHLDDARPKAKSHDDKRVVKSVDGLIDGAEAMMAGDVAQAQANWSGIPDPHFNREVRVKAGAVMGVKVPMIAKAKEVQK
jgi:hypothetical protein